MKFWKLYFVETCVIVMQTLIMYIELLLHDLSLLLYAIWPYISAEFCITNASILITLLDSWAYVGYNNKFFCQFGNGRSE
jgi:hypothetical protein